MSRRSQTRVSRPLIAILGVTIVAGGGAYLHSHHQSTAPKTDRERLSLKAVDPAVLDVKAEPRVLTIAAPTPPPPTTLITQTPATAAAASTAVAQTAPTTRPAQAQVTLPSAPAASSPVLASLVISPHALEDAKAKIDAGDLLSARQLLNESLIAGKLSAADADSARHSLTEISQSVTFSRKHFKDDPFEVVYQVQPGERLARIADKHNVTWELLCRINGLSDPRKVRSGQSIKIPNGPFHCVITKSTYRLDVYLGSPGESGSLFVAAFPVGLGKDNSTPTGCWMVQSGSKAHPATYYSPRGEGVIAADDPKNPLGGYWMGLTGIAGNAVEKNSYGIHGTIDPDSIGKQASMGCIRLGHEDIALLYDLLVDGKSKVVVKD